MPFPWMACVVGSLSFLPQLGISEKRKNLKDLESCDRLDTRSDAPRRRQYCWYRGQLAVVNPIVIRINQGGHIFNHKLAKYRFESFKVTRTLMAFVSAPKKAEGNAEAKNNDSAPKGLRIQKWRTDETKTQTSPLVYASSISVDGKYSIDRMRHKLPTRKLQTVFTESAELRSASENETKGGGTTVNVSVKVSSTGGELNGDAVGEGNTVDVGYKHTVHGIRDGDIVTVVGDLISNDFSEGAHFCTIDDRPFEQIVADSQNYIWWAQTLTVCGLAAATGIGFVEVNR